MKRAGWVPLENVFFFNLSLALFLFYFLRQHWGDVLGQSRTQVIRGWPGPPTDDLVSVTGLALAGH